LHRGNFCAAAIAEASNFGRTAKFGKLRPPARIPRAFSFRWRWRRPAASV